MIERFFPQTEYEDRWRRAQEEMARRGLDRVVVWSRSAGNYERIADVLYLTNYAGSNSGQIQRGMLRIDNGAGFSAVILRRGEVPELVADEPPRLALIATERYRWSFDPVGEVIACLKQESARGRFGFSGTDFFPMVYWAQMQQALPDIEWVFCDDLIEDVRIIKSPRELEAYRIAGRVASTAMGVLIDTLQNGGSEADAAGAAAREVVRGGGHPHMIPISHGPFTDTISSRPVPGHTNLVPPPGSLAHAFVYGNMFEGYWCDPGRTFVIGRAATAEQQHLIEATNAIVERCMALCRPGTDIDEVIALGEQLTREFAPGACSMHERWPLYGHGVGMFWAPPVFSPEYAGKHRTILRDMVMSSEAFLSLPGVGSSAVEQNFIITDGAPELLTTTPLRIR